jgi:hypothetical protein
VIAGNARNAIALLHFKPLQLAPFKAGVRRLQLLSQAFRAVEFY